MSKDDNVDEYKAQLDWIRFRQDVLADAPFEETAAEKISRKIKENPFVPLGAFATLCALSYGLWCFRKGRSHQSQKMMRVRVGAQGLTIVALLGGCYLGSVK